MFNGIRAAQNRVMDMNEFATFDHLHCRSHHLPLSSIF